MTQQQLRAAVLNDPAFVAALKPPVQTQTPEAVVVALLQMWATIEVALACRWYRGCTREQAVTVFRWSDQEQTLLVDPTRRVLDKYASAWLARFGDEIALATLLLTLSAQKFAALRAAIPASIHPFPQAVDQAEGETT